MVFLNKTLVITQNGITDEVLYNVGQKSFDRILDLELKEVIQSVECTAEMHLNTRDI